MAHLWAVLMCTASFLQRMLPYSTILQEATPEQQLTSNPSKRVSTFCRARERMVYSILALMLVLWLIGWTYQIGGAMIHLLLVVALVALCANVFLSRRTV